MRKIAHVPFQTWKGWNPYDFLGGWFSPIRGLKTMFGTVLTMVLGCLMVPCLLPLVTRSALTLIEAKIEQKMATQLYLLQSYQRVNPIHDDDTDDAFWQTKYQSIKVGNDGAILAIFLRFTLCLEFTLVSAL
jgi:hypothetical protein